MNSSMFAGVRRGGAEHNGREDDFGALILAWSFDCYGYELHGDFKRGGGELRLGVDRSFFSPESEQSIAARGVGTDEPNEEAWS